jgi:hypothetical protein
MHNSPLALTPDGIQTPLEGRHTEKYKSNFGHALVLSFALKQRSLFRAGQGLEMRYPEAVAEFLRIDEPAVYRKSTGWLGANETRILRTIVLSPINQRVQHLHEQMYAEHAHFILGKN